MTLCSHGAGVAGYRCGAQAGEGGLCAFHRRRPDDPLNRRRPDAEVSRLEPSWARYFEEIS